MIITLRKKTKQITRGNSLMMYGNGSTVNIYIVNINDED